MRPPREKKQPPVAADVRRRIHGDLACHIRLVTSAATFSASALNPRARSFAFFAAFLALLTLAAPARTQVQSYTVGLDVNCPYGIRECWVLIRDGLGNIDGVGSVSERVDHIRNTCEVRWKNPGMINATKFADDIVKMGVGTRLRGLELTADGTLERDGDTLRLRLDGQRESLRLLPLREKIQMEVPKKRREPISEAERDAFKNLLAQLNAAPQRIRITGPLVSSPGIPAAIEVRAFELLPAR
jgi:hypothetical protein